jgi:DNA repair protein RecO (recombination protein O)
MTVEKTKAFVLKANPYRESSCLLYLYSERHGLVHGIAKGVRRKKSGLPCLERGFLAELLLYARPHRDLHTLAGISILDFFPNVRTDLRKNAVRDMAFEVIIKTMSTDAPHPDVFTYLAGFLFRLETLPPQRCFPAMAWQFLYDFSSLMGFGPNIDTCALCGRPFAETTGAHLLLESGTCECVECSRRAPAHGTFLPAAVLASLSDAAGADHAPESRRISAADARRIIHLFARFCRYHFQTSSDFKSIDFLDSLLCAPAAAHAAEPACCTPR